MNWYYVENGQQAGPVDDNRLTELVRNRTILPDTLVWREGMQNWTPFSDASPASGAVAPAQADLSRNWRSTDATAATAEAVCVECGRIFPIDEMVPHGGSYVCANCKPIFIQKLAEGARLNPRELNYAGFWIRFAAVFVDGIILWVINFCIGLLAGLGAGQMVGAEPREFGVLNVVVMFLGVAIGLSYETILIGRYGATLGKMACKIRVVTSDGGRVSYLRALGRYFGKMLSSFTCLIGYIMAGFDGQKRALHDYICNTRVVQVG